jgi:putative transposase
MARLPRLTVAGHLHVVMQRAHGGRPVFLGDQDFDSYRRALVQAAAEQGVAVHAFALTPSQVLLLVTPSTAAGPSRMLQAVGRRFGAEYNRRHGRTGALWDGRFRATVVEPKQLVDCSRWIEWAPVRAGLVATAGEYAGRAPPPSRLEGDTDITSIPLLAAGQHAFRREAAYRALLDEPPTRARARTSGHRKAGRSATRPSSRIGRTGNARSGALARGRPR